MLIPETQTEKQLLVLLICIPAMLRVSAKESLPMQLASYKLDMKTSAHSCLCPSPIVLQNFSSWIHFVMIYFMAVPMKIKTEI